MKLNQENTSYEGHGLAYELSVILITPDHKTIRFIVEALQRQTAKEKMELIIVAPFNAGLELIESDFKCFAGYQRIEMDKIISASAARAAGVRAARSPVVVFTEDHCFPDTEWAEAIIKRHKELWAGVGPVVYNANPCTAVSWTNFIIDYGEWAFPVSSYYPKHIPGHNSSYKTKVLLDYGAELESVLEAESPMQWDLMSKGYKFCLEPEAKVYHMNFSVFLKSAILRFYGGRLFAANRSEKWCIKRKVIYFFAGPLIPLVRIYRCLRTLNRIGKSRLIFKTFLFLFMFLCVDGLGEMYGYITGSGKAMMVLSKYEFHREYFLHKKERKYYIDLDKIKELSKSNH